MNVLELSKNEITDVFNTWFNDLALKDNGIIVNEKKYKENNTRVIIGDKCFHLDVIPHTSKKVFLSVLNKGVKEDINSFDAFRFAIRNALREEYLKNNTEINSENDETLAA